jgi:hypothetical protein
MCKYYRPWQDTSRGEINDVCVDEEKRTMQKCDWSYKDGYCHLIKKGGDKPYRKWQVTVKEVDGRVTTPIIVGAYTLEEVRAFFGLDKPGACQWYKIEEVEKGGAS